MAKIKNTTKSAIGKRESKYSPSLKKFYNDEIIVKSLFTLSLCISNQGNDKLKNILIDY